ncbi:MAG: methyl-accepting chemotaxis protein [Pseudomonadota bacterium]
MPLKYRLAIIAGFPLLCLIAFSVALIMDSLAGLGAARQAVTAVETSGVSSALISELQRERGLSAAYLSDNGNDVRAQLQEQRAKTDQRIDEFSAAFTETSQLVSDSKSALSQLYQVRTQVDNRGMERSDMLRRYRDLVDDQLAIIGQQMNELSERGFGETPGAYIAVVRASEMAGLERAMGAAGFTAGAFTPDVYRQFAFFRGGQAEALGPALQAMPVQVSSDAASLLDGSAAQEVIAMRDLVDASQNGAALPFGLANKWWAASTARIDRINGISTLILAELEGRSDTVRGQAVRKLALTLLIALGCFGSTVAAAVYSVWRLAGLMSDVTTNLHKVLQRDYDFKSAGTHRRDEVGQIARSMDKVREKLILADKAHQEATYKGQGFEGAASAMMVINRDLEILYMNKATRDLFIKNTDELRKLFPSFDAHKLIGVCIDSFHTNPEHQRRILADPSNMPFTSEISLGDLRVVLHIDGAYDDEGNYVGNVLEWIDVTQSRLREGLIQAIDDTQALIQFDLQGNVLEANKNFQQMMGYGKSDLVGLHHRAFCPDEFVQSPEYQDLWQRLNDGEYFASRIERVTKSGERIFLDASYNPVLDGKGRPFKVVKIGVDATADELERRKNELERQSRAKDLSVVVESLADGLSRISTGDFSRGIEAEFAQDYIELKTDFNEAVEKLAQATVAQEKTKEAQNLVVSNLEGALLRLSQGDLSVRLAQSFAPEYEGMRQNFNRALGSLMDAMSAVVDTERELNDGTIEVSRATDNLSQRTEQQAATLEQTTATITEITATVAQSADGAKDVNTIVKETDERSRQSGQVVEDAVAAMGRIEESSTEIASIINVIDDIAFQTNLLALNAGVEAARAGDAGRGFAVVAQEVRGLAQRCTGAAKEIKALISTSSDNVASGVALVNSTGEALSDIGERIGKIKALASDIATSAEEQSIALQEVSKAVSELDAVTQQNAAMVEETTAASHSMRDNATRLAELMAQFRLEGDEMADDQFGAGGDDGFDDELSMAS